MRAGARGTGLRVCARLIRAANRRHRRIRRVWVLDSLIRRRFREAARPRVSWRSSRRGLAGLCRIASNGATRTPAPRVRIPAGTVPVLQRQLRQQRRSQGPVHPGEGTVRLARRVVRNVLDLPVHLGETLTAPRGLSSRWACTGISAKGRWPAHSRLGCLRRRWRSGAPCWSRRSRGAAVARNGAVPLYLLVYIGAMCLTPFPGQSLRYLMPVAPLIALLAIVCWARAHAQRAQRARERGWARVRPHPVRGSGTGAAGPDDWSTAFVYVTGVPANRVRGPKGSAVGYSLFFSTTKRERGFDEAIDLHSRPRPSDGRRRCRHASLDLSAHRAEDGHAAVRAGPGHRAAAARQCSRRATW